MSLSEESRTGPRTPVQHLPRLVDDVLIEIIRRLPLADQLNCCAVSRHWRQLSLRQAWRRLTSEHNRLTHFTQLVHQYGRYVRFLDLTKRGRREIDPNMIQQRQHQQRQQTTAAAAAAQRRRHNNNNNNDDGADMMMIDSDNDNDSDDDDDDDEDEFDPDQDLEALLTSLPMVRAVRLAEGWYTNEGLRRLAGRCGQTVQTLTLSGVENHIDGRALQTLTKFKDLRRLTLKAIENCFPEQIAVSIPLLSSLRVLRLYLDAELVDDRVVSQIAHNMPQLLELSFGKEIGLSARAVETMNGRLLKVTKLSFCYDQTAVQNDKANKWYPGLVDSPHNNHPYLSHQYSHMQLTHLQQSQQDHSQSPGQGQLSAAASSASLVQSAQSSVQPGQPIIQHRHHHHHPQPSSASFSAVNLARRQSEAFNASSSTQLHLSTQQQRNLRAGLQTMSSSTTSLGATSSVYQDFLAGDGSPNSINGIGGDHPSVSAAQSTESLFIPGMPSTPYPPQMRSLGTPVSNFDASQQPLNNMYLEFFQPPGAVFTRPYQPQHQQQHQQQQQQRIHHALHNHQQYQYPNPNQSVRSLPSESSRNNAKHNRPSPLNLNSAGWPALTHLEITAAPSSLLMSSLSLATEQTAVAEPQSPSTSSLAVPTTPTASSSSTAVASALPRKLFRLGWKQSSSSTTLTAAAAAPSSPTAAAGAVTASSPTSDSNSAPQPPLRPTVGLHDTLFINQHWSLLTSLKYGLEVSNTTLRAIAESCPNLQHLVIIPHGSSSMAAIAGIQCAVTAIGVLSILSQLSQLRTVDFGVCTGLNLDQVVGTIDNPTNSSGGSGGSGEDGAFSAWTCQNGLLELNVECAVIRRPSTLRALLTRLPRLKMLGLNRLDIKLDVLTQAISPAIWQRVLLEKRAIMQQRQQQQLQQQHQHQQQALSHQQHQQQQHPQSPKMGNAQQQAVSGPGQKSLSTSLHTLFDLGAHGVGVPTLAAASKDSPSGGSGSAASVSQVPVVRRGSNVSNLSNRSDSSAGGSSIATASSAGLSQHHAQRRQPFGAMPATHNPQSPRPIANGSVAAPVPSADLSITSASDQRATCYLRRLSMISVPGLERTLIREVFNMSPFLREFKCDMINKHRQQMALKRKAATNAINTPMS